MALSLICLTVAAVLIIWLLSRTEDQLAEVRGRGMNRREYRPVTPLPWPLRLIAVVFVVFACWLPVFLFLHLIGLLV